MKKVLFLIVFVGLASTGNSQSIVEQLNNSVERAFGGSGATVEYHIYLTPTIEKVYRAYEWDKGQVVAGEDGAQYFELTRKRDDETESMTINLEGVAFMELEVKVVKGKKEFTYNFFF